MRDPRLVGRDVSGPAKDGAAQLLEVLADHGVDTVFGLPGVHNLPIWEALKSSGIQMVGVRHEQAAAYAADGYARATGKVGVAVVTSGPGAANTLAATGEARASGSPVLVIATDVPAALRRPGVYRGLLHESRDQQAMFEPVVKNAWTVPDARSIAAFADRAVRCALQPPTGPVYLGVPTDLLTAEVADPWQPPAGRPQLPFPGDSAFDEARRRIEAASRPLIWVGCGALRSGARAEVSELAYRLAAPVVSTYGARGLVSWTHPYAVHGLVHVPEVGRLWDEADLVIAIGTDLDGPMTQNWTMPAPRSLLAVNIDPDDASKNYAPDAVLVGDARPVLARLLELLPLRRDAEPVRQEVAAVNGAVREAVRADEPQAELLMDVLEHVLPADAVLVADMCVAGYWVGGFHRLHQPGTLLYPIGWGTLGFGFPASLGAAAAGVGRVLCICGDGGFLFGCSELATAVQEQLPVTVVIVDDSGYGMLRYDQITSGYEVSGVDLCTPDFVGLARAFGVEAAGVTGFGDDFAATLTRFLAGTGPNVLVTKAELTPPPTSSTRWYRQAQR